MAQEVEERARGREDRGTGARGGELREGYAEENAFAFLRIERKEANQKNRSIVVFWIPREATVEKIKLVKEAFGEILAFFHRESDFNRN
jgi:hypothetical protein